jgi:hypothetical protein
MEVVMKTRLSVALAGLVLAGGVGTAAAQSVVISPEGQTVIREYVIEHPVEPVENLGPVELGEVLPESVEMYPLEDPTLAPEYREYRYVVVEGRTYLVEPGTRRIIYEMR